VAVAASPRADTLSDVNLKCEAAAQKGETPMMLDWNLYLKQITSTIGQIATVSPDVVRGYRAISDAGQKTGKLDAKTRELISLAVAVTRQCDGCIAVHTDAALKAGATKEELVEALGVAVAVNAGAALVYSARALDAFTAKTSQSV
jgi:AhpD family alkylhydroperoxidase